jgi:hypothetical protein
MTKKLILLAMLAIGVLSIADRYCWHTKHFPWSTYETVGAWHGCDIVGGWSQGVVSVAHLKCVEGQLDIYWKTTIVGGASR